MAPPRLRKAIVQRERLLSRLRSLADPAVYVVHGPPGYGKSTLLAQLADADARDVRWLTLVEDDADPVRLLADLAFALGDGKADAADAELAGLIDSIGKHRQDSLIVVDDVHHVSAPEGDGVLAALVENVPLGSTLVLAGRTRPRLPIARLVAAGTLTEIAARELRMTVAEGTAMLGKLGTEVEAQEAELLVGRTEGWAAALYLVGRVTLNDGAPAADALRRDAELADYLRDEVLAGVDPETVRFLLDASILEELAPADCDAILERSDSAVRLAGLAKDDLFVVALDAHGGAYHIHGLFREALDEQLCRLDPDRAASLHRRAAAHHAVQGRIGAAVHHSLAGGDATLAAELLFAAMPEYQTQGQTATLKRWLGWFSDDQIADNPCLALSAGWVAVDEGDGDAAEHWATIAREASPDAILPTGAPMGAHAQLLDAAVGARGVLAVREAAASAGSRLAEDDPVTAVADMLGGAAAYVGGDIDSARTLLFEAQARAASRNASPYRLALAHLALIAIDDNDWEAAEGYMARVRLSDRADVRNYVTQALCDAVEARLRAHRGERLAARDAATRAKDALAAQRRVAPMLAALSHIVLADAYVDLESIPEARTMVAQARRLVEDDPGALLLNRRLETLISQLGRAAGAVPGSEALTHAELATLRLLVTHFTQREIAERLCVTRNTVHTHAGAIYRKLGVTSRSEAIRRAGELGLLDEMAPA